MQHIYLSCRCKICIEHSRTVEAALSFSFKKTENLAIKCIAESNYFTWGKSGQSLKN